MSAARSRRISARLAALLLAACVGVCSARAQAQEVRASDYRDFWLWAGVAARPETGGARTLYLHQGEIGPDGAGGARLMAQGGSQPHAHAPDLWLVYRVRSLDWPPEIVAGVSRRLAQWRAAPGRVVGVQLDFDAGTRGLDRYAAFLRDIRGALPKDCALGVTGLMDWASQARAEDLNALSDAVDELVFQTYRGARTVADIDAYMRRIGRVRVPFRLGLAEGAQWRAPPELAANPYFRGYVVFLRNAGSRR